MPFWAPGEVVAQGAVRMTALGVTITRNAAGTTGTDYDATEAAKWTVTSGAGGGGGAVSSVAGKTGAVTLTAADVVGGTFADNQIPASIARDTEVAAAVAALVDSSPAALDTLKELASALGNDANYATTVNTALAARLTKAANLSDLTNPATARTNLGLAGVAASGAYADLSGRPVVSEAPPLTVGSVAGLRKWHAALAKVRAGVGFAKVACVGDSTTQGGPNPPTNPSAVNSYPARLTSVLNPFIPSLYALWNPKGNLTEDTRLVASGSWGWNGSFGGANGSALLGSGASGTLAFSPGFDTDTLEVYYLTNSGNGSVAVNVDGGASLTTLSTNAALDTKKATVTTTVGAHVWNLVGSSVTGNVLIWGLRAYNSATKQVHFFNLGRSGATTESSGGNWTSTGNNWGQLNALDVVAPDLTIISLGVNDAAVPLSVATYQANLLTIINRARLTGDVLLLSMVPSNPAQGRTAQEVVYTDAMAAFAQTNNVPYLDAPWGRWGGFSVANPLGLMADDLHPSPAGYADMAHAVRPVLANV